MLIISEYNCAALALTGCLQINPFNLVETAEGALTPPSLPSLPSTHARAGTIARLQARLHMLLYYMVARLHDFLHACTIARLHDCTVARLHTCTLAHLHVSCFHASTLICMMARLRACLPACLLAC